MDIETRFYKLLGRQPTDDEKLRLYRVKDALGLDVDDSLWLVLMALDHYLILYERIPAQLAGAAAPLEALGRAPEIVTALESATAATERVGGLWSRLTARGLTWGLALGLTLGLALGSAVGIYVLRDFWLEYERWNMEQQIAQAETQRRNIGANYAAFQAWAKRGATITSGYIVIDAEGVTTGTNKAGQAGIWINDK